MWGTGEVEGLKESSRLLWQEVLLHKVRSLSGGSRFTRKCKAIKREQKLPTVLELTSKIVNVQSKEHFCW